MNNIFFRAKDTYQLNLTEAQYALIKSGLSWGMDQACSEDEETCYRLVLDYVRKLTIK